MVGKHQDPALVVLVLNIMRPPVRLVDVQPPYHLFPVKIVLSIVTSASRPNAPRVVHAGKSHAVIVAMTTVVAVMVEVEVEVEVAVIVVTGAIGAITGIAGKRKNHEGEVVHKMASLLQACHLVYYLTLVASWHVPPLLEYVILWAVLKISPGHGGLFL